MQIKQAFEYDLRRNFRMINYVINFFDTLMLFKRRFNTNHMRHGSLHMLQSPCPDGRPGRVLSTMDV